MSVGKLPILRHYLRAKWAFAHLRGERLAAYQERRAQEMVQYAVTRSLFYREHWRGCDLNDWRNLPFVDKTRMMANFDTFNTVGIGREAALEVALRAEQNRNFAPTVNGCTVGLSSGTSGRRGLFVASAAEQEAWAGTLLARALPQLRRQGWRVALFLRSNSNLYEQVGSRLLTFRYFDLMLPPEEAIQQLAAYQPDILVAPPSCLTCLSKPNRQNACLLNTATNRISPAKIISVAEVLGLEEREQIAQEFAAPLGEIYQATEGLIGITCSQGALHLQEDVIGVQLVPLEATRPQYVTPIITDLWRTTQPILRYQLGDIWLMDDKPCACGSAFRIIERVLGRVEDILYFPCLEDATRHLAVFPDQVHELVSQNPLAVPENYTVPNRCTLRCFCAISPTRLSGGAGAMRAFAAVSGGSCGVFCQSCRVAARFCNISIEGKGLSVRGVEIVHEFPLKRRT